MRIAMAALNFAPEPTGIGRYSGELAAWLASRGHEVVAISAPPHYPDWEVRPDYVGRGWFEEEVEGATVLRTPVALPRAERVTARVRVALESSYTLAAGRWWAPRMARREVADVAIAVAPPVQSVAWPWLYGSLRGVPWLLHVQDLQVDAALRLGVIRDTPVSRLLYGIERQALRRAPYVSTITPSMLARVREKGVAEERSFVFPNWTDLTTVTPRSPDPALRRRLGAGREDTLVLYSGNLGEKQGLEVVLDAAERLRRRDDVRFAIVGNGAARAVLRRRADELGLDNVSFHDLVPAEALPDLLAAGDVHLVVQKRAAADLVMPSKLTNILAAGRPTVATADPGTELHEVVSGHATGIAVAPEDGEALAEAVDRFARDPSARRDFGARARAYAETHLDKERILEAFEDRLERIAKGAHRG